MSSNAIVVSNLSKCFQITRGQIRESTLGETLVKRLRSPFRKVQKEEFWALQDVNFEVPVGDVVGIIGRNGAGKSTLLKVLSRITAPTIGEVQIRGKVGSLLEVGTGFHSELTGRENIYLNGAILGMRRREIDRQFDAIVDFAGTERFLDTPVKRYSSGMYVRLAFAVAAHLNPAVMIVDEVLAVGDSEFQKKCLGKMHDVAKSGRTVLFVSHNMHSVAQLCATGIYLQKGKVMLHGPVAEAIEMYVDAVERQNSDLTDYTGRPGTGRMRFTNVKPEKATFTPTEDKTFHFRVSRTNMPEEAHVVVQVTDDYGTTIAEADSRYTDFMLEESDCHEFSLTLSNLWLKPGRYHLNAAIRSAEEICDGVTQTAYFHVSDLLPYPVVVQADQMNGLVLPDFKYRLH